MVATGNTLARPIEILLAEDSATDAGLTKLALARCSRVPVVHHVKDGEEAMAFLRQEGDFEAQRRPDLLLLDLNMPRKDGREVLAEIRSDPGLHHLPVVILTTSSNDRDVQTAYNLNVNSYVSKPVDLDEFTSVIQSFVEFWLRNVTLPSED